MGWGTGWSPEPLPEAGCGSSKVGNCCCSGWGGCCSCSRLERRLGRREVGRLLLLVAGVLLLVGGLGLERGLLGGRGLRARRRAGRDRRLVGQRVGGPLLGRLRLGLLGRLLGGRLGGRLNEVGLHVEAGGGHLAGQHPGRGGLPRLVGEVADDAAAVDDTAVEADGGVRTARAGQAELDALDRAVDEAVGPGQAVAAGQARLACLGGDGGGCGSADEDGDAVADRSRDRAGGGVARHVGRQDLRGAARQRAAVAAGLGGLAKRFDQRVGGGFSRVAHQQQPAHVGDEPVSRKRTHHSESMVGHASSLKTTVLRSLVPSLRSVTQLSSPEAGDVTAPRTAVLATSHTHTQTQRPCRGPVVSIR
ncbi:hypothetical protein ACFMQL_40865 [Nonomuraea fastidiosa]|uniref:hypothetical protein n=1 Tax=Nonomuraea fastidiosa TaxID=46173 RepID=UPI003672D1E6